MDKKVRSRTIFVGLFFTLFFLVLIGRLYWVQVADRAWLMQKAATNWKAAEVLPAQRGVITDRNGKVLAEDGRAYIVTLRPKDIAARKLEKDISRGLAEILVTSSDPAAISRLEDKIYEMATRKKKDSDELLTEVQVQPEGYKIDAETKDRISQFMEELKVKVELRSKESNVKMDSKQVGIFLYETEKRSYPYNRLASQVLGFVDKWGEPVGYGLEASLNEYLKGTPGKLLRERDRYGVDLPNGKLSYTAPEDGKNVKLTLDQQIQYYTETAIRQIYEKWNPRGVTALVADPKSMEILAMASMPDYNPNKYWEATDPVMFRNMAVSYTYEPGSTMKLVPLAGAMEEGLYNANELYQSGHIVVGGRRLGDHNGKGWGQISYMEGLLRSSNVAFVKLGVEKLGNQKLLEYINQFGFGQKTGIDLPGEQTGVVQMRYPSEFATATYGQGLTVTAIQQLASYGAIANGGKLMKPYVIKEIRDPDTGEAVLVNKPELVRQVVSPETAKEAALALEQVVANQEMGTGRRAFIEGYRVAGKTGTANIVLPGVRGYATGKWLISFAGFAPVEDPKVVVVIVVDVPDLKGDYHLGGEVASPAFKEIVSQSLSYLGVTTAVNSTSLSRFISTAHVPDTVGLPVSAAKTTLGQARLKAEVIGDGDTVVKQIPLPGSKVSDTQRVYLMTREEETDIPNLTGKSLRDALEICSLLGIKCKTEGEGYVVEQKEIGDDTNRELELILKPAVEAEAILGEWSEP